MTTSRLGRRYGWTPELPDQRDLVYHAVRPMVTEPLPEVIDHRPLCPPVQDQGQLGSCTAHAAAGAVGVLQLAAGRPWYPVSRLATYYWTRAREGTTRYDAGATIRDTAKTLVAQGSAHEDLWPYVLSQFRRRPPARVGADAARAQVTRYLAVPQDPDSMRRVLADGFPIMVGFSVYASFETPDVARTGMVPMPRGREANLGGHAVLIVGYNTIRGVWIVRNSWGPGWGDRGYCYMPEAYLTDPNLAGDLWAMEMLEP